MAFATLYIFLGLFLGVNMSWSQSLDPLQDMCARWHHQSTIHNNFLYIDGGVETFNYGGTKIIGYNQQLLRVDMRDSWDWQTNISQIPIPKSANPNTGTYPPSYVRGALFQGRSDGTNIYSFGGTTCLANESFTGWRHQDVDQYSLWSYDVSGDTWQQYDVSSSVPRRVNQGASTEAANLGLAFYLNGQIDQGSSAFTEDMGNATEDQQGLIILNTENQTARNISTASLGEPRVAGGLQYIEGIGSDGVIIALGGMRTDGADAANMTNDFVIGFDTMDLCDDFLGNGTWYSQPTTGDVPPRRTDFCLTTATAPDNSSYNIYMYGGINPNNLTIYDDIYVLSLPSFKWIQVYGPGESPRWGHTCHFVGNRQMLTVGGAHDSSIYNIETTAATINTSTLTCDWEYKGVAIYDMTKLIWGSVFDAYAAPYQVPTPIFSAIGGSSTGNATMVQPEAGFASAAVATMFANRDTANTTNSPPQSTLSSTSGPPPASPASGHAGLIAGSVIGGIAGLGLIIGAVTVFFYRRAKNQPSRQPQMTQIPELGSDNRTVPSCREAREEQRHEAGGEWLHEAGGQWLHEVEGEARHELPDPSTVGGCS